MDILRLSTTKYVLESKQPYKTDVLMCEQDGYIACICELREHENAIIKVCGMEEAKKPRKNAPHM